MGYQKVKILRKKDLDLYSLYKKWSKEISEWEDNWFVKVSITRHYPERTIPQNKYYWMLMDIFAKELGWDKLEADKYFVGLFGPIEIKVNEKTGEEVTIRKSTSMMNTAEMVKYVDQVRLHSIEQAGVYLPLPNEAIKLFE